jgi:hypothetical protein
MTYLRSMNDMEFANELRFRAKHASGMDAAIFEATARRLEGWL